MQCKIDCCFMIYKTDEEHIVASFMWRTLLIFNKDCMIWSSFSGKEKITSVKGNNMFYRDILFVWHNLIYINMEILLEKLHFTGYCTSQSFNDG